MNIYLAKLREKPIPNVQYKRGLSVFLGQKGLDNDEIETMNDEPNEIEVSIEDTNDDTVQEEKHKRVCKISDNRSKEDFDYRKFMETLRKQRVFPVTKQLKPSQMPEFKETEDTFDDTSVELKEPDTLQDKEEKEENDEIEQIIQESEQEEDNEEITPKIPKQRVIIKRKPKKPKDIALEQFDGTQIL